MKHYVGIVVAVVVAIALWKIAIQPGLAKAGVNVPA